MKKKSSKGFMLVETLIVTIFVSSILIFLLIQFTNLSNNYDKTYDYNKVEDINSLKNIIYYIENDQNAFSYIQSTVTYNNYLNITNCDIFAEKEYCEKLFELENIKKIIVSTNKVNYDLFKKHDEKFKIFVNKIKNEGEQKYRLIASTNNNTYVTVRFGD